MMKFPLTILMFCVLCTCLGQPLRLTESDFNDEVISFRKSSIPRLVKKTFKIYSGERLNLANPNKAFRISGLCGSRCVPERKLIYVIETDKIFILYYEHGGRSQHFHCLVFFRGEKEKTINRVLSLNLPQKYLTIEELKTSLLERPLDDLKSDFCQY